MGINKNRTKCDREMFKLIFIGFLIIIAFFQSNNVVSGQSVANGSNLQGYRLPDYIVPSQYSLYLLIDVENAVYNGNVTIIFHVKKVTKTVSLNFKDINVKWQNVILETNIKSFVLENYTRRDKEEIVDLNFIDELSLGSYAMKLSYSGNLHTANIGLYRTTYEMNNQTR